MTITAMHEPIWINQLQTRRQDLTRGVIDAVRAALLEIYAGRPVVVIDRSAPDHPGHLMMAARRITDADVAWLVRHTSGVLCVPLPAETCDRLHLAQMVRHNPGASAPAFTVSVDAAAGITTGISAADRGITIRLLADPAAEPDDLSRPGHVFPIRAETVACSGVQDWSKQRST